MPIYLPTPKQPKQTSTTLSASRDSGGADALFPGKARDCRRPPLGGPNFGRFRLWDAILG
jgi:hypothetical protein